MNLKPKPHDADAAMELSLQEFINFWRGGRLKVMSRGTVRPVTYFKACERILRKIMSMMGHFRFADNPELAVAIDASMRKTGKLALSDWMVLIYTIKLEGSPKRNDPISIFTGAAVDEIRERYVESLAEAVKA